MQSRSESRNVMKSNCRTYTKMSTVRLLKFRSNRTCSYVISVPLISTIPRTERSISVYHASLCFSVTLARSSIRPTPNERTIKSSNSQVKLIWFILKNLSVRSTKSPFHSIASRMSSQFALTVINPCICLSKKKLTVE